MTAFPWQRAALVDIMGVRADGRWAASRAGLCVPRQNGKNGALEILELWVMAQLGMRVLHSAHEVKTARKAFKRLLDFFDNPRRYPELAALVSEIRRTNGQEAIELHNGGGVEFVARTKSSGRGYSADVLVMDEAQELTDDELEAMQPIVSASANSQIILTGTAPKATKPATVWRRYRKAAESGGDLRLCWVEHSAHPDADPADRETQAEANPGAPESIGWEAIEDEHASMSAEGFAAERLGIWSAGAGSHGIIDLSLWQSLNRGNLAPVAPVLGVELARDRSSACIGSAQTAAHGPHLQVVDERPGVDWLVPRLVELRERYAVPLVVLDKGSEAASLAPDLERAGVPVLLVSSTERAAACGSIFDLACSASLSHNGDPSLEAAWSSARWRESETARSFSRQRSAGSIASLYAVTFALFGLTSQRATEPRIRTL